MHFVGGITPIGRNGLSHQMDLIEDRLRFHAASDERTSSFRTDIRIRAVWLAPRSQIEERPTPKDYIKPAEVRTPTTAQSELTVPAPNFPAAVPSRRSSDSPGLTRAVHAGAPQEAGGPRGRSDAAGRPFPGQDGDGHHRETPRRAREQAGPPPPPLPAFPPHTSPLAPHASLFAGVGRRRPSRV